jgi:hypothetical protein
VSCLKATLVSVVSILRCLPLLLSARPRTPLRVLCIMSFDMLHTLRNSEPLPGARHRVLAALLDFGASTNAMFDNKEYCREEIRRTRLILNDAGLTSLVEEFLRRLWKLERRRRSLHKGGRSYEIRSYRESVARLYLGVVATAATGADCIDEGIRATQYDGDFNILFRLVMQCQIIDDVLDYSRDRSAGLPSFLTATESLSEAITLTHQAACSYANTRDMPQSESEFPLRRALGVTSTCAKLMIQAGRWKIAYRHRLVEAGRCAKQTRQAVK